MKKIRTIYEPQTLENLLWLHFTDEINTAVDHYKAGWATISELTPVILKAVRKDYCFSSDYFTTEELTNEISRILTNITK
ncbi:MAG: hypothetical protein NC311_07700 [Muribaculaceae bacterium]|nr:hypothetical protein [Muribaculaceae bacterium]